MAQMKAEGRIVIYVTQLTELYMLEVAKIVFPEQFFLIFGPLACKVIFTVGKLSHQLAFPVYGL